MSSDRHTVGRYVILRPIGQGAVATVYLARQLDLDRLVALKELDRFGADHSEVFAARFLREARLAGSLSHANIVTVHEYFEHDGRPYIAMEYVEGGSLREHMTGLSLGQIIGVLAGLLAGLACAEAREIVHRDIKPENILIGADGQVKIADFGIASAYSLMPGAVLTSDGATPGTPMYMAPEQASGNRLSIATDLYAVGIVGYEMFFGCVPFECGSPLAISLRHVNEPVPDAQALRPDLGPRLCGWLQSLLAKDPAERPASAARALDALEEIALELLGSRWRREAVLLPHAGADPGVPARDARTASAGRAGVPIMPPQPEQIQAPAVADPPLPSQPVAASVRTSGWSPQTLAVLAAALLIPAVGGYLAFHLADPRSVSPSTRFEDRLAAAFQRLNVARVNARTQMATTATPGARATEARAVAAAYRVAAGSVSRLMAPIDRRDAVALVSNKLIRAGQAYNELADTVTHRDSPGYGVESHTVDVREQAVQRALDVLDAASAPGT